VRGICVSRRLGFAVTALSLAAVGTFSAPANAQTAYCWIDAATGQQVPTAPLSGANFSIGTGAAQGTPAVINPFNPNQAGNSKTGQNFVRQPDGSWVDAQTGSPVPTVPLSGANFSIGTGAAQGTPAVINPFNPNQAGNSKTGQNFVRVPCPPTQTSMSGGYLGGELAKNWGRVRSTETRDATGVITNQFIDSGDPLGVGIVGGYNFKPWNNNIVIGPFASFDYLTQTINHNFAGGQFLGTTTHWFINAGVKAGVVTAPGLYLYGLAAAAWLNHDLNVNFATAAQSNVTTPGFTLGVGGEYQPSSWQLAGHPVSLFAQYQHTWWSNANFNTPTSSPAFNYAFRREDDTIKFGVNFYFGSSPAAPTSPAYPVKAPPLK
jgi:nitrate reductase NapE component